MRPRRRGAGCHLFIAAIATAIVSHAQAVTVAVAMCASHEATLAA